MENVRVDKPVDAALFQYSPPADAKKVDKFTGVQRPTDARTVSTPVRIARNQ